MRLGVGTLLFLVVAYLLLSYSVPLGFLLIVLSVLAVLVVRKNRGSQTVPEQRLFEAVGWYGRSARRAYEEGKHRELAQDAYQQSKRAYEGANARYQAWRENQAAERERNEILQVLEQERGNRRARLDRYKAFFERASTGSRAASDWWRAYQDEEADDRQPTVADLLQSAHGRAEAGLGRATEIEGSLPGLLQQDLFGEVDKLLDALRTSQEDLRGNESVFVPLVEVHNRIKRLDEWKSYREELERLVKDLEDLLASPTVRTAAANRVRFPDPNQAAKPHRSPSQSMGGFLGRASTAPNLTPKEYIDMAIPFMLGRGFSLEDRSDTHVTFVRKGEEMEGASCLVEVILLCMGLLPGILYAIYLNTRRMHTTFTVVVVDGDVRLTTSGNDKGGRSTLENWVREHGFG